MFSSDGPRLARRQPAGDDDLARPVRRVGAKHRHRAATRVRIHPASARASLPRPSGASNGPPQGGR
eukprot:6606107-Lingulodinium_polyedra.AAC.1